MHACQPVQFENQALESEEGEAASENQETNAPHQSNLIKYLKIIGWLVGNIRNAIIVAITSAIAYLAGLNTIALPGELHFRNLTLTGQVPEGLPPIAAPQFSETYYNTAGQLETIGFNQIINSIAAGILICSILGYLECYAIGKSFASLGKYPLDGEQEMYAIGTANFFTSFTFGFPVTGSFSRSSINNQCGVATPVSGFVTAGMIILSLLFLTDLFYWIPTAALGAVIILAAFGMFKLDEVKHSLFEGTYTDRFLFVVTFCICLYETSWGIVIGAVLQALIIVGSSAFPKIETAEIDMLDRDDKILEITFFESNLRYAITTQLTKIQNANPFRIIHINLKHVLEIDNTAALAIVELVGNQAESGVIFCRSNVKKMLFSYGLTDDKLIHSQ